MKPATISVFLLFFLLPIAAALVCYHCHERNSDTCEQEQIDCPEGEQCITISEKYAINGTYHSIFKGCAHGVKCGGIIYTGMNNNAFFTINNKCCNKDLCNEQFFELEEVDDEPNGVVCPTCLETNNIEDCKGDKEYKCRGNNDICYTFSGDVEKPDGNVITYIVQGCTSSAGCEAHIGKFIGIDVLKIDTFKCPDNPGQEEN
ncbi:uncharacterized protein [Dendropsophus ebraccatus]|uniref:uncharacterized protein n=1 Tax=Dendropsophus ebraccatus TaxID=150705 RepID=UPI0038313080